MGEAEVTAGRPAWPSRHEPWPPPSDWQDHRDQVRHAIAWCKDLLDGLETWFDNQPDPRRGAFELLNFRRATGRVVETVYAACHALAACGVPVATSTDAPGDKVDTCGLPRGHRGKCDASGWASALKANWNRAERVVDELGNVNDDLALAVLREMTERGRLSFEDQQGVGECAGRIDSAATDLHHLYRGMMDMRSQASRAIRKLDALRSASPGSSPSL